MRRIDGSSLADGGGGGWWRGYIRMVYVGPPGRDLSRPQVSVSLSLAGHINSGVGLGRIGAAKKDPPVTLIKRD